MSCKLLPLSVRLALDALAQAPGFAAHYLKLWESGALDARFKWYGWDGAREYLAAIASGDIASEVDIDARRLVCSGCPSRVIDVKKPKRLGSCGPKFVDRRGLDQPTCGCPIEMLTCIASKRCPQGKYGAVLTIDGRSIS